MKLLLITVLVGAALAKPTVQPPRQSDENSTEGIILPRADAENLPLLRGAAPTRPTSSSVEKEDLQKKPVEKTQIKPKVKSAAQTYTVPSAVPTKVEFSAPAIKAVRFTPQFITSDEDEDGNVVALATAPAEGSVPQKPESAQPVGGVTTDSTVDALPTESTKVIAEEHSAGPTIYVVDPVDKTEVAKPEFITYSKNFAVVHNYAVAPRVNSVAGDVTAYSVDSTVDALRADETTTEFVQPIARVHSTVPTVDALPVEETATESAQPIAEVYSDDSTEDVVHKYVVAPNAYSVSGGLPAVSTVDALPVEETTTESAQPISRVHSTVPTVDVLPAEETATESAQPIARVHSIVPTVNALPVEETTTESAQPIARVHSTVPSIDVLPAEETATESAQPIAGVYSDDSTEDAADPVDKTEVVEPEFTTYSKNFAVVHIYAVAPSVYSVSGGLPADSTVDALAAEETTTESAQPIARVHSTVPTVDALPVEETATESAQPIAEVYSDDSAEAAVDPVNKTEVVQPEFITYSKNFDVVPSYAVAPNVYSVAGVLPAVSHVSTIPFSENFVSTNQIYSESNIIYSSPSVYSSPVIYHSDGIIPSHVYDEDD